VQKFNS